MTPPALDARLLLEHRSFLRDLARQLLSDEHLAEDAFQEACAVALERPPRDAAAVRAWLAAVVRNFALRTRRRERERPEREGAVARELREAELRSSAADSALEVQHQVARALVVLPEPYRGTLWLRYYQDLSPRAIAARTGVPVDTVKTRLRRGLERLRADLDDAYGERRAWGLALAGFLARRPALALPPSLAALSGVLAMKILLSVTAASLVAAGVVLYLRADRSSDPGQPVTVAVAQADAGSGALVAPANGTVVPTERAGRARLAPSAASSPDSLAAPKPARAAARVVDDLGRPVADALVTLVELGLQARTSLDGRATFDFDVLERRTATQLDVEAEGYLERTLAVELGTGVEHDLGAVELVRSASVRGRVVDVSGLPVAGAYVQLAERGRNLGWEARPWEVSASAVSRRADANGAFVFDALRPSGGVRVWAAGAGKIDGCSAVLDLVPGARLEDVVVRLENGAEDGEIAGRVVLPVDVAPEQVQVWVQHDGLEGTRARTVGVDESGRFRVRVEEQVPHTLWAGERLAGWDDRRQVWTGERALWGWRGVKVEAVQPGTSDALLSFVEAETVGLEVVDTLGQPLPRFTLGLVEFAGRDLKTEVPWSGVVTAGARLALPASQFYATFSADGFERVVAGPFDPRDVPDPIEAVLETRSLLRGKVVAGGRPVAGALVQVLRRASRQHRVMRGGFLLRTDTVAVVEATTDERGHYEMTLRRVGEFLVVASADGWAASERAETLDPTAPLDALDFTLTSGGSIEGRVLPPPGTSPAGWIVGASRGTPDGRRVTVGADGTFRFDHLTAGPWWVGRMTADPGIATISSSDEPVVWSGNCEVYEGEVTDFDLDFSERELCLLHGRIEVSEGGPVSWNVELFAGGNGPFDLDPLDRAAVPSDGSFELSVEGPGPYSLTFEHQSDDGWIIGYEVLELRAGDNEIELELEFGRLAGRLSMPDPAPPMVGLVQGPRDGLRISVVRPSAEGHIELPFAWAGPGVVRGTFSEPTSREAVLEWQSLAEVDVPVAGTALVGQ